MKPSKRKTLAKSKLGVLTEKLEHLKASVRANVEHPFHVVKNLLRHGKTRYIGLAKSTAQFLRWQIWCRPGDVLRHRIP